MLVEGIRSSQPLIFLFLLPIQPGWNEGGPGFSCELTLLKVSIDGCESSGQAVPQVLRGGARGRTGNRGGGGFPGR